MNLDDKDKRLISILQKDIPLESRPFKNIGEIVGLDEEEVVDKIRKMSDNGVLKRLAPLLHHRKAGFEANGMVVWQVPRDREDEAGLKLSQYDEVSHCYLRETGPEWKYNLYSMVHTVSEDELEKRVKEMAEEIQPEDYAILRSTEELKKTSLKYFSLL